MPERYGCLDCGRYWPKDVAACEKPWCQERTEPLTPEERVRWGLVPAASSELGPCRACGGEGVRVDFDEGPNAGGTCGECLRCGASSVIVFGFKETWPEVWNSPRWPLDRPTPAPSHSGAGDARTTREGEEGE